jgi:hypothetical protein
MPDPLHLSDIADAVVVRSDTATTQALRDQIDKYLNDTIELLRKVLPADHWYVRLVYQVINSGARAKLVYQNALTERPDAGLPLLDVLYSSKEEVETADLVHKPDGSQVAKRAGTATDARKLALYEPKKWLKTFLTVQSEILETSEASGLVRKQMKPFDLDGPDSRSVYQRTCYGAFLDRWATDSPGVPETTFRIRHGQVVVKPHLATDKHYIGRTKPRKVGSTTFWKKFSVLCGANIDNWSTLLHFPESGDAKAHLRDIADDLRWLHSGWPQIYPPLVVENYTDGYLELSNGSSWLTRHGDSKSGGVAKVGHTGFNLVILSEAGKYERRGSSWQEINQAILPAVHPSTRNVIAWEGTNDETAHELNRIAVLNYVDFQFFGWTCMPSYIGDAVGRPDQQTDPTGSYADYIVGEDGEPTPISERDYAEMYRLTANQVGFRRRKIDELEELTLVHREYPITYEESLGLVAGGFFLKIQPSRPPETTGSFEWSGVGFASQIQSVRNPVEFRQSLRGMWHLWCHPERPTSRTIAVAADFADGLPDSDYTTIGVADVETAAMIASLRTRIAPEHAADEIAKVCSFFGANSTWVIGELNGPGKTALLEWEKYHSGMNYTQIRIARGYTEPTEQVWFLETRSSREPLLLSFRKAYHNGSITIEDARFEWDAEGFMKDDKGKYRALESKSVRTGERYMDDMVMMCAMLWELISWLRARGLGRTATRQVTPQAMTMLSSLSPRLHRIVSRTVRQRA